MSEIWKTAVYRGVEWPEYEVSSMGRVRSLHSRWGRRPQPFMMRFTLDRDGYPRVRFTRDGRFSVRLNRLVCETFHGTPPPGKSCALHGNDIRTDCSASNLRWGSPQDNVDDRTIRERTARGANARHTPSLTDSRVAAIKYAYDAYGVSDTAMAAIAGISRDVARSIRLGNTWTHVKPGVIPYFRELAA